MSKAPIVSVIMSVYNGDKLSDVKDCIKSITTQTFEDFELIVVDDGITKEELKKYVISLPQIDERIRILHNEKNSGLAFSMNQAIQQANGDFFARMDADDLMLPERLEKQLNFLNRNTNIDIVGSFYYEINEQEEVINQVKLPVEHDIMVKTFPRRNPLAHVSVMMRRRFIDKSGLYPIVTTDQDTLMWVNGLRNGAVMANIPDYLLKVRVSENFYKRRSGFKKALQDAKNRMYIIKQLKLSSFNIVYVGMRFIFQLNPFHKLTYFGYKYLRK